MRVILESLRYETIPADVVEVFLSAKIAFYEGCLIVQVRDYRVPVRLSSASAQWSNRRPEISSDEAALGHRSSPHMNSGSFFGGDTTQHKSVSDANKNGKADASPANEQLNDINNAESASNIGENSSPYRIYRTVLKPTAESLWQELCLYAESMLGRLGDLKALQIESEILLATQKSLFLDSAKTPAQVQHLIDSISDRPPPGLLKKKRSDIQSVVEKEAKRAEDERYFLILDELNSRPFQPSFQKLSYIEQMRKKLSLLKQQQQSQTLAQKRAQVEDSSSNSKVQSQLNIQQQVKVQRTQPATALATAANVAQKTTGKKTMPQQQHLLQNRGGRSDNPNQSTPQAVLGATTNVSKMTSMNQRFQTSVNSEGSPHRMLGNLPNVRMGSQRASDITDKLDGLTRSPMGLQPSHKVDAQDSVHGRRSNSPVTSNMVSPGSMQQGSSSGSAALAAAMEKRNIDFQKARQQAIYLHHYASSLNRQGISPQAMQEAVLRHAKEKGMDIQMVATLIRNLQMQQARQGQQQQQARQEQQQ